MEHSPPVDISTEEGAAALESTPKFIKEDDTLIESISEQPEASQEIPESEQPIEEKGEESKEELVNSEVEEISPEKLEALLLEVREEEQSVSKESQSIPHQIDENIRNSDIPPTKKEEEKVPQISPTANPQTSPTPEGPAQPQIFAMYESEGLDISHIFSRLSLLKMEIKKRQNIQKQNYERSQGNQEELTKSLKRALQTQFDLLDAQEKLCPLIPRAQGPYASHGSNPMRDLEKLQPRQVVEDSQKLFEKQRLYIQVRDLLFTIRGNPQITAEIFRYLQEPLQPKVELKLKDKQWLKPDLSSAEFMVQQMLDNPFQDTSATHDGNLLFFNTLMAYHALLNPSPAVKLNGFQIRQNNIMTREQLCQHVSTPIFYALIKAVEAQSYLRFIYKNIFSKINLIQLIAFINEKEATMKRTNQMNYDSSMSMASSVAPGSQSARIPPPSNPQHFGDVEERKQPMRKEDAKESFPQGQMPVTPNAKTVSLTGPGQVAPSIAKPQQSEELKKEKKSWLQSIFSGKSKKEKEEKNDKKEQLKAEKQRKERLKNNQHSTFDPILFKKFEQQQQKDQQQESNLRATQPSNFVRDDSMAVKPQTAGALEGAASSGRHRREMSNSNTQPPQMVFPDISDSSVNQSSTLIEASVLEGQYRKTSVPSNRSLQKPLDTIEEEDAQKPGDSQFQFEINNTLSSEPQDTLTRQISSSSNGSSKSAITRKSTEDDMLSSMLRVSETTPDSLSSGATKSTANPEENKEFDAMMQQQRSAAPRLEDKDQIKSKFTYTINQYDLTGYMLHILMKVSEILYLSVCQIPTPIRSFVKLLAESIITKNPQFTKVELYRILNELIVDRWLSVSFLQPEFFGILPKPLNFSDKYKNIFFHTAQKVLQYMFRMEPIDTLPPQYADYFDIERINEYIKHQKDNIMMYYEYFLNIDVSVYEQQSQPQSRAHQKNVFDVMAIRADLVQRIIALIHYDGQRFYSIEPKLEDFIDKIDMIERIDNMDQQYGIKVSDAAVEITGSSARANNQEFIDIAQPMEQENTMKVMMFLKTQEINDKVWRRNLKKRLEQESEKFMVRHNIQDKDKFRQLIRNLTELVEQPDVQFPSFYQIVRNKQHEHIGNDLSVILFYLIRGDECINHSKDTDDKDKMRLQCIILYKNLQTTGVMGNIGMQCKILQHIIERIQIETRMIMYGDNGGPHTALSNQSSDQFSPQSLPNGPMEASMVKTLSQNEAEKYLSFEELSLVNYCVYQDINLFMENMRIEREYCEKIKHAYDLTNFILLVKPFVCLNYDHNGFNLVRQDKCDKHQANPLLTGQLLFGIVQTSNPTGAPGGGQPLPVNRGMAAGAARGGARAPQQARGPSGQQPDQYMQSSQSRDKLKHYQIKRIDFFIIAFQNKFRSQFRQLIALDTLGRSQGDIDYMNLRTTYSQFLQVIRNLLENDPALRNKVHQSLTEINEYIMKQLHRHIFVIIDPSPLDVALSRNLQKKQYTFESLDIPIELHDDALWLDAICTFDKFSKEETPVDKLMIIARTLRILNQIFHMASSKESAQATADDEYAMLTYVVSKSISAFKLYSNFQFIKLFGQDNGAADNLQRSLSTLESVIIHILDKGDEQQQR